MAAAGRLVAGLVDQCPEDQASRHDFRFVSCDTTFPVHGYEATGMTIDVKTVPPSRSIMPPRIPPLVAQPFTRPSTTIASILIPFVDLSIRPASILSSLSDNPSAYSKKIRRGRGPSSGKGKTSGRGQKGQKARGKVPKQFNGGQTPEAITHGKMGFKNV